MTPEQISEFAAELGIEDGQLIRFHRDCVRKHKAGADEWLLAWLYVSWQELRDEPRFPAKQNGLLHPPQYVSTAVRAIDDAESIPSAFQNVLVTQARERWVEDQRRHEGERETARDLRRINQELAELAKRAVKMGVDPMTVLGPIAREIQKQHSEIKKAA